MARHLSAMVILAVAAFLTFSFFMSSLGGSDTARTPHGHDLSSEGSSSAGIKTNLGAISEEVLHGGAIAPKLENATAKYVSNCSPALRFTSPRLAFPLLAMPRRSCAALRGSPRYRPQSPIPTAFPDTDRVPRYSRWHERERARARDLCVR